MDAQAALDEVTVTIPDGMTVQSHYKQSDSDQNGGQQQQDGEQKQEGQAQ